MATGLKLANVFNKMSPAVSPTAEQDQQRSRNLGSALQLAAQVAGGQGIDPQASGFQQALTAGLLGGAQGFTSKADMQKAKAQDEYNAWVQEIQKTEMQAAQAADFQEKEKAAIMQASIPALSAYQQYTQTGDKAAYETKLKSIGTAFASSLNAELINLHLAPGSDQMVVMTLSDLDGDGQQDTRTVNLAELIGPATELNAEFAKGMLPVFGVTPPAKETKVSQAEKELGRPLTEAERMELVGLGGGKAEAPKLDKGQEEILRATAKKDAEFVNNLTNFQAVIASADRVIDELARTGVQTGPVATLTADILGSINTITGVELFKSPGTIQRIEASLAPQVFAAVKNLGAGTGISNADREFAAKTIGGATSDPRTIATMQAIMKATSERNSYFAQAVQAYAAGDISRQELEAFRTRIYGSSGGSGQAEKFSLQNLASRYEQEYLQKLAGGVQQRTGATPPANTSVVDQFGLEM